MKYLGVKIDSWKHHMGVHCKIKRNLRRVTKDRPTKHFLIHWSPPTYRLWCSCGVDCAKEQMERLHKLHNMGNHPASTAHNNLEHPFMQSCIGPHSKNKAESGAMMCLRGGPRLFEEAAYEVLD